MKGACFKCSAPISRSKTGMCRRCVALDRLADPARRAARTERMKVAIAQPDRRARRLALLAGYSRAKLAWCPLEYRADYRKIAATRGTTAAEARRVVEELIAKDAARFARTGLLQQSRRVG